MVILALVILFILFRGYGIYNWNYSPKAKLRKTHISNAKKVTPDMSKAEVISIMGKPDVIHPTKFKDYSVIYRYDTYDESEPYVSIYLDSTMSVKKVHYPIYDSKQ